jgi:CubicO group peptidase (beta-lactamase class C family)
MLTILRNLSLIMLLAFALLCGGCDSQDDQSILTKVPVFISASSTAEVRHQIAKLPRDDVWWNVYGEDQAWNFKNLHRFMPTVTVYRYGEVRMLTNRTLPSLASELVQTPMGRMGFKDFLDSDVSRTMGIVVLHKGDIVFEHYPRQQPYEKPIYWSVTKVLVSALVGILEDRGQVDISLPIVQYLPKLGDSDFANITVRNLLDMATGLDCPEEYVDRTSCYYQYSTTIGDGYWSDQSSRSPYSLVASLKPGVLHPQGEIFQYSGVNTFILSWLVEELMGMPFQDALSKEIWQHIGAEADAALLAPRYGVPNTHGGLLAQLRDVARFGLLYTPSYHKVADHKIISDRMVRFIRDQGNPKLWKKARIANKLPSDFLHSVYQWDAIYSNHDFYKGGWAGQGLLVNPDKDIVAVFTGYAIDAEESQSDLLPILRQVLNATFPDQ